MIIKLKDKRAAHQGIAKSLGEPHNFHRRTASPEEEKKMRDPDVVKWFFRESSDQGSLKLYRIKIWHKTPNEYNYEPLTLISIIVLFFFDINTQNSEYEIYTNELTSPDAKDIKNAVIFIKSRMENGYLVVTEEDEVCDEIVDGRVKNKYLCAMKEFICHQHEKHCVRRLQNELNQNLTLRRFAPMLLSLVEMLRWLSDETECFDFLYEFLEGRFEEFKRLIMASKGLLDKVNDHHAVQAMLEKDK